MSKLTAKQQAWIDYYKQGHSATESARLAGLNLSVEQISEAWENIKGPLVETIDRFKRALSAAAVAFIEAMNQEETP